MDRMPAMQTGFLKAGHSLTLFAAFLYFDLRFMARLPSLTVYSHDQHGLSPVVAGCFFAAAAFVGSLVRPLGGTVADRIGGE